MGLPAVTKVEWAARADGSRGTTQLELKPFKKMIWWWFICNRTPIIEAVYITFKGFCCFSCFKTLSVFSDPAPAVINQRNLSFLLFLDTFGKGWKVRRLEGWKVGRWSECLRVAKVIISKRWKTFPPSWAPQARSEVWKVYLLKLCTTLTMMMMMNCELSNQPTSQVTR